MKIKFLVMPLILVAMFTSCSPAQSGQTSQNISSINQKTYIHVDWPDVLSQEDEDYLLFFYSNTCQQCHEIMGDVYSFIDDHIKPLYLVNTKECSVTIPLKDNIDDTIGMKDINELFIKGTPSIIEVKDATVVAHIPGKSNCLTFLNDQRLPQS